MFGNKKEKKDKEKELKTKILKWWLNMPYLKKIEILLDQGTKPDKYPEHDITQIEYIGVRVFWNYNSLEKKALIMEMWEKERSKN